MRAIILAAGMGNRLMPLTKDNTKCMVSFGSSKIIDKMLSGLSYSGINEVTIVVGHGQKNLISYLKNKWSEVKIDYVISKEYKETNNMYSLSLVKDIMCNQDVLLLESDLVFDPDLLKNFVEKSEKNAVLVDEYLDSMDGASVKIEESSSKIISFYGKQESELLYRNKEKIYKTINVYKFSKEFSRDIYVPFLETYLSVFGRSDYYEDLLRVLHHSNRYSLQAYVNPGYAWIEIDNLEDLSIASDIFSKNKDESLSARFGGYWRFPGLIDFSLLVNPTFPDKNFFKKIKDNSEILTRSYPSNRSIINNMVSSLYSVPKEFVTTTNGASEAISALSRFFLKSKVGMFSPSFDYFEQAFVESEIVKIKDFSLTGTHQKVKKILDRIAEFDVFILINPDNPSGQIVEHSEILSLAKEMNRLGKTLILDESFIDFYYLSIDGSPSLKADFLKEYPNVILIKSFGKSMGVPGLRLGAIFSSDTALISSIDKNLPIWNVGSFSEYFLQQLVKSSKEYSTSLKEFYQIKKDFFTRLSLLASKANVEVIDTSANFLLLKTTQEYSAEKIKAYMFKNNILIKDLSKKISGSSEKFLRIAIGSPQNNLFFLQVFAELINAESILSNNLKIK